MHTIMLYRQLYVMEIRKTQMYLLEFSSKDFMLTANPKEEKTV